MLRPRQTLKESVGRGSPHQNLKKALDGIFEFHKKIVPTTAGLFAEPRLFVASQLAQSPRKRASAIDARSRRLYMRAEQRLGRIAPNAQANLAAALMMSASFYRAFVERFFGTRMHSSWPLFAECLLATLMPEAPRAGRNKSQ
jgi:hypothetical protein